VAPFHTDSDEDNPVYHDNSDCPYGQEIKRNDNDKPGKNGRRRCDWCSQHA
jgi:H+-transporting ATPase